MRIFKDQIIGGTSEDSQGEKLPIELLREMAAAYEGKRQPLNQGHDLSKNTAGYLENIRVEDHPTLAKEYVLRADVYCDESRLEESLGGFSISYREIIKRNNKDHEIIVYLPYPHYNDTALVDSLFLQVQPVSVGKWVKKAADPATTALIGAGFVFLIKPVWDDLYKTVLAPKLYKFFRKNWALFKSRNINIDLAQTIEINGHQIQLILIPDRSKEDICFSPEFLDQSMQLASIFVLEHDRPSSVKRIDVYFHSEDQGYQIHRVEDDQGNVEHFT